MVIYYRSIIHLGPASAACAETLRQEGFKGKVVVATKEEHRSYDRTMLSKVGHVSW